MLHRRFPRDAVLEGIACALSAGAADPRAVEIEVRRAAEGSLLPLLEIGPSLAPRPAPGLSGYDDLLEAPLGTEAEEAAV